MFITKIKKKFLKIQNYAMCKNYYFLNNLISFIKKFIFDFKIKNTD